MMEVLKQPQYEPMSVAQMAIAWFTVDKGFLDDVDLKKVCDFEAAFQSYLRDEHQDLLDAINSNPVLSDEIAEKITATIETFKKTQAY